MSLGAGPRRVLNQCSAWLISSNCGSKKQNACGSAALAERLAHSQCELTYERKGVGCLLVKKLLRGLLSFALQQLLRPNIAAAQFHEGAGLLQVSYNSLLGIGATGWPRSLSLLVSCGTSADVTSYTSMMSMISPYRWDEGMSLMNRLNSHGLQCDEVLASSLMRLTSWRRGTHLLSSFSSLLLRADVVAVGACSNSCAQSGQWNQAMNFASQLSQMDLKCSLAMINSLLGARNVRWEVAADLFRCFQPDLITVNGAAAACDKAHEWQRAVMLVQQARQFQLQSDSILHSIATDACQRTLKWEAALAGFQACQGVQPCIVLFNTAIAAGTWQLATHFFAGLPQCQMSPSIVTCSATLERLAAGGQWEAAWKLLSTSGMDQPSPSQVWCSAFQGSGAPWEAVLRIYKTMQTLAGQPDATMLAAVADTCEESQRGRPTNLVALCGNVAQEALSTLQQDLRPGGAKLLSTVHKMGSRSSYNSSRSEG
ncbi:Pentatricopeptide repeat-containing protein At1g63080 [Durusdinium trenchii]|uniref:Mitochondrial n=1 Tax=Durusdinium trenchii TaxID=1381693 RepID=A0ABP0KWS3_9DINO